jgi:hypothetical protein
MILVFELRKTPRVTEISKLTPYKTVESMHHHLKSK